MSDKNNKKCVVAFSNGLDSRLAVKVMQERGWKVYCVWCKLPFNKDLSKEVKKFCRSAGVKLKIFDCSKGKLLKEYLQVIADGKFGRGKSMNPCVDCRIFILSKVKEFADSKKINLIVTGEVVGERPMSQMRAQMSVVEGESGLKGRLFRPLSAKLLGEVKGVDKGDFYDIEGRQRREQIKLAKKFKISYPEPAGGCVLCERNLKHRIEFLLKRGLDKNEVRVISIGRHFVIGGCWIVVGRDERENKILEKLGRKFWKHKLIGPFRNKPSALILDRPTKEVKAKVKELVGAYVKGKEIKQREAFEKFQI